MIKSAAQILAEIGEEEPDVELGDVPVPGVMRNVRMYPPVRRSRLLPPVPCRNADRGCPHHTKGKRSGHGWCGNCYARWSRHGDSWYHSPNVKLCRKKNCFMRAEHDKIARTE